MTRARYNRKESRERGFTAIVVAILAVVLLVGSGIFLHWVLAEGNHKHISLHLVGANVVVPLLALWLVSDWVRYRHCPKKTSNKGLGK